MIKILSLQNSEGYIINPKGILTGKVLLPELLLISNKDIPLDEKLYNKFLSLDEKCSVFDSIEKIKDFVVNLFQLLRLIK